MSNPIIITKLECLELIEEIKKLYSKDIFKFSVIETLCDKIKFIDFEAEYDLTTIIKFINETLKLLKTNGRSSADFEVINMSKNFGILLLSKKLTPKMKFIAESITGYFEELIFEVPNAI